MEYLYRCADLRGYWENLTHSDASTHCHTLLADRLVAWLHSHYPHSHRLIVVTEQPDQPFIQALMQGMQRSRHPICCLSFSEELPEHQAGDIILDADLMDNAPTQPDHCAQLAAAFQAINDHNAPVIALHHPSGTCPDSGIILPRFGLSIKADDTLALQLPLAAMCTADALDTRGNMTLITIDQAAPTTAASALCLTQAIKQQLHNHPKQPNKKNCHKGDFGHLLIIGGDYGMGGAVRLAAEAALRVGCGQVTVATRPEHVTLVCADRPEIMAYQIEGPQQLIPLAKRANVIAIGPGLGRSDWASKLFNWVMSQKQPMVIDADALHLLHKLKLTLSEQQVITPHPGEAASLLSSTCQQVQHNRFAAITALCQQYQATTLLKGAGSIIQAPGRRPLICPIGNPSMAVAGMGDVLTGIIASLISQGHPAFEATCLAVWLHAEAASHATHCFGERGILACDVIDQLRHCVNPNE